MLLSQPSTAAILNEIFAKPLGEENIFGAGEALATLPFYGRGQVALPFLIQSGRLREEYFTNEGISFYSRCFCSGGGHGCRWLRQ